MDTEYKFTGSQLADYILKCKEVWLLEKADPWQPIETAPKDGTDIILYTEKSNFDGKPSYLVACWKTVNGVSFWQAGIDSESGNRLYSIEKHTHWQPSPEPPKKD